MQERRSDEAPGGRAENVLPADEDTLAIRSREGDPVALAVLYRRLAPSLLAMLERTLRDPEAARDVLHETFLRVFEGRGGYDGRGRFRAWIFTVAARIALDLLRRRRRRGELRHQVVRETAPAAASDPEATATRRVLLERVEAVLADLPESHAVTFHLRVREEMTYAEIAEVLGEPEGTLRSRVHHVLRRVRRELRPRGSDSRSAPRGGDDR